MQRTNCATFAVFYALISALLSFSAFSQQSVANTTALTAQQLEKVLLHPDRPSEDAKRDSARQPAKIMQFAEVFEGAVVLDLFAGQGWYSELFSRAVGPTGKVYAQNDEVIWRFAEEGIKKRTKNDRLANVVRFDNMAIADISVPDNSVDIAFIALNYHDLFFTYTTQNGKLIKLRDEVVDHKVVLSTLKSALKDTGVAIIIDHYAHLGSGYEAANIQHRIDPNIVKYQFEEAGFSLLEEAYYLRNPEDDLSKSVFDPSIRGSTDRFIYKFGKNNTL